MLHGIEQSLNAIAGHPRCRVVLVPQVQLAPFVAASIEKFFPHEHETLIFIHPHGNIICRQIVEALPRAISVNIRTLMGVKSPSETVRALTTMLDDRFDEVSYVLHAFAGGINQVFCDELIERQSDTRITESHHNKLTVALYADGSRNNVEIEFTSSNETPLLPRLRENFNNIDFFTFGFERFAGSEGAINGVNERLVEYNHLDCILQRLSIDVRFDKTFAESDTDFSIVLSRYWGRPPYLFSDEAVQHFIYTHSVEHALRNFQGQVIYRTDNRRDITSHHTRNLGNSEILTIEDLFNCDTDLREILFEIILMNNPDFLSRSRIIYCFDSSFPLIFQSPMMKKQLHSNLSIVIGFKKDDVKSHGVDYCFEASRERTCNLVRDIIALRLFYVFDENGPLIAEQYSNVEAIKRRFDRGSGFFYLRQI
nr:hypothetical protein [uncultured Cohaesibacter sp.]